MNRPSPLRDETGFTLVELLVVIAILGIIAGALTESIIIGLRTTTRTESQLVGSIDRQRVAAAFVPDVQSAQRVEVGGTRCGPTDGTEVVTLSRADRGGVDKRASYVLLETTGDGTKLLRRYCEEGRLSVEKVVADHLAGKPQVDCATFPTCTYRAADDVGIAYEVSATRRAVVSTTTAP